MNKKRFSDEANIHYKYDNVNDLMGSDILLEMIDHHQMNQVPRLEELEDYYRGNNRYILTEERRKDSDWADYRATHAFAEYISTFVQGYMVGVPLKTSHPDDDINDLLMNINRLNDADEHNSSLVLDQSIFGRAYELLYRNQNDEIRFVHLDVKETFVIYDSTVEMKPICAVRYYKPTFNSDDMFVELYTDSIKLTYRREKDELILIDEENHSFQGVPINEYVNNRYRLGDFERVLNLIDLYDSAQSDIANYSQDLNDAMLKVVGNLKLDDESVSKMKKYNIIVLKTAIDANGRSSNADADYIYKKYDVQGMEAYKNRLFNDILKFTSVPNLLDEHFSGNQSGEALKMKMFGMEQKRATKERMFKKGLRQRYRLINNMLKVVAEGEFDVNDITITFTENIPKSIRNEMEWFAKMGGKLSDETLLSMLPFIENPKEEMEKIKMEQEVNSNYYEFPLSAVKNIDIDNDSDNENDDVVESEDVKDE